MASLPRKSLSTAVLRKSFFWAVMLGLVLVILSRVLIPTVSLFSLAGAVLILMVYYLAGYFGFQRIHPEILTLTGLFGLVGGTIFAGEILLEYALLPQDNTNWGIIEFGGVFAIYFFSGLVIAYQQRSIRVGVLAGPVSAMFSSIIWLIFVFTTFYLFRGTARQAAVFTAEGNYADFAHSGMTDFNAFIMEDFLGAAFFHLLLAPCVAAILGIIGGTLGKGIVQFKKQQRPL